MITMAGKGRVPLTGDNIPTNHGFDQQAVQTRLRTVSADDDVVVYKCSISDVGQDIDMPVMPFMFHRKQCRHTVGQVGWPPICWHFPFMNTLKLTNWLITSGAPLPTLDFWEGVRRWNDSMIMNITCAKCSYKIRMTIWFWSCWHAWRDLANWKITRFNAPKNAKLSVNIDSSWFRLADNAQGEAVLFTAHTKPSHLQWLFMDDDPP